MPELPEIEAAAAQLREAIVDRPISRVETHHRALARTLPPRDAASLAGRSVARVERRGKHQVLHLDDGRVLVAHFRLNGEWNVGRAEEPLPRFTRVSVALADGTRVALVDGRALCTFELADRADDVLPKLGPDPLGAAFTADALGAALARRRGPIKVALLDQGVVAGLGNIYAAEALWLAKISPTARASSLSAPRRAQLVRAIKDVLHRAPPGRYWLEEGERKWRVYDREGERCKRCRTPIKRTVQATRSTFSCPECQAR